uniref:serine/threonine-protein kinase ULK3 isoform X5 n=1 Tax=Nyctereutes procyonoides TaxID=34880 RepID=UPI0024445225|nr:serine/threonine-protein kinase ULK3 isoform X5 [Nyctereutes procyonoides]
MAGPGWGPPRLDGFILTERLGSGTYATVYKAYAKKDTREVVAIKCVAKKSLNKASVENLLTEIEILKGIRHPHIVQLRDFQVRARGGAAPTGRWRDAPFQLPSASACRRSGTATTSTSSWSSAQGATCPASSTPAGFCPRRWLASSCSTSALQFLHEQNISHLDLKPQNILLSSLEKPHLKLAEALFGQPPFASRSFTELEEKIRSNRVIELPLRPPLSRDCRDLLQRLLERDPNRRISFQDFFAHPWVDLEHMPSGESLARATALVVQAVKKDQDGDAAAALSLYCKALDFFVPALHYEVDAQRKEAIKAKVGQYVSRAEELKAIVSSSNQALLRQGTSAQDLLREMARDKPRLLAALEVASAAMAKEEETGGEQDALDLYQRALGELLVLLAAEPTGRRRELLHTEVQNLMARAEYLKEQVKAVTYSGAARWGPGPPGSPSPLGCLYAPQMRESRWAAETLDKEGLSESVRTSCTLQ